MTDVLSIAMATAGLPNFSAGNPRALHACCCSTTVPGAEAAAAIEKFDGLDPSVGDLIRTEQGRSVMEDLLASVGDRVILQVIDKRECLVDLIYEHFFHGYLDDEGLRESRFDDFALLCLNRHIREIDALDLDELIESVVQFSRDLEPVKDTRRNMFIAGFYDFDITAVCGLTELAGLLNDRFGPRPPRAFGGRRLLDYTLLRRMLVSHIRAWGLKGQVERVLCAADEVTQSLNLEPHFGRRGLKRQCNKAGLEAEAMPGAIHIGSNSATTLASRIAEAALLCVEAGAGASGARSAADASTAGFFKRLERHLKWDRRVPATGLDQRIEVLERINKPLLDAMIRRLSSRSAWLADLLDEVPEAGWYRWMPRIEAISALPSAAEN